MPNKKCKGVTIKKQRRYFVFILSIHLFVDFLFINSVGVVGLSRGSPGACLPISPVVDSQLY